MSRIGEALQREFPDDNRRHGLAVASAGVIPVEIRGGMTRFIALLSALVGLVLLIACFNATGMLLARGVTRAPELGMRLALGAARMRVVRLLVVESLAISLAGAIVGLGGASGVIDLFERAIPLLPNFALSIDLFIDWRVVAFSVGLAVVTGLGSGLGPALAATRVELGG